MTTNDQLDHTVETAMLPGPDGKAVYGKVKLPKTKITGDGEREVRQVCDLGRMHSHDKGKATVIYVLKGVWPTKVASGDVRDFQTGECCVVQDGELDDADGHQSGAIGEVILVKTTVDYEFEVVDES